MECCVVEMRSELTNKVHSVVDDCIVKKVLKDGTADIGEKYLKAIADFQVTFAEAFAGRTFSTQRFFDSPTYKRISLRLRISFLGVLFDLAATGKVRTARKKHSVQSKSVSFFVFIGFSFMAWTEF